MKTIIFIGILLSVMGCILSADRNNLILPGKGIASFRLYITTMEEVLGEESSKRRNEYAKQGLYFQFEKGNKLTGVTVTSPDYQTDKGVKVGDSMRAVISAYGDTQVEKIREVHGKFELDALKYDGIFFILSCDEKVEMIFIGELNR